MSYGRQNETSPKVARKLKIENDALLLRLQGYNYDYIGEKLGLKADAVGRAVRSALKRQKAVVAEKADEVIQLELQRLDTLFLHAMAHVRAGNVNAVTQALKVMERRTKYLGLDAPVKTQITQGPTELDLTKLTDEQLADLERLTMEAARESEIDDTEDEDYADDAMPLPNDERTAYGEVQHETAPESSHED